jgi:hypothetical protein
MKKWISIMGGLLVAQLVLAVTVHMTDRDYATYEAKEKLLGFDEQKLDRLLIEDGNTSVTLKNSAGQWVLPKEGDFPASQKSVSELLDKLAGLEKGWPVATSSGASRRFKVAEDEYERRLTLYSGDDVVARLYVGTSPGFRKVHLRPDGDEAVYVAEFNTWEAGAEVDDWLDKTLLKLNANDLQSVEIAGELVLRREEGDLRLAGLTDRESPNEKETHSLLSKLTDLTIQSLKSEQESAAYNQQEPQLEIEVTLKDGERLSYLFFKSDNDAHYVLKRSDMDRFFEVPSDLVNPLKEASREKLVLVKESQTQEAPKTNSETKATQEGEESDS